MTPHRPGMYTCQWRETNWATLPTSTASIHALETLEAQARSEGARRLVEKSPIHGKVK